MIKPTCKLPAAAAPTRPASPEPYPCLPALQQAPRAAYSSSSKGFAPARQPRGRPARGALQVAAAAAAAAPEAPTLPFRVGHGWDLHRLEPGYPLIVGGIDIPHDRGCVAHSGAASRPGGGAATAAAGGLCSWSIWLCTVVSGA